MENALYKCILKPLRDVIYAQLLDFRSRDGTLGRLREHQLTMRQQSLAQLGVAAGVPVGASLERIQTKLSLMHQAYSPKKKETQMLKVCKMLYEALNQTAGKTGREAADGGMGTNLGSEVHSGSDIEHHRCHVFFLPTSPGNCRKERRKVGRKIRTDCIRSPASLFPKALEVSGNTYRESNL